MNSGDDDAALWSAFDNDFDYDPDIDYEDDIDRALFPPASILDSSASPPPHHPSPSAAFYRGYTESLQRNLSRGPPLHERVENTLVFMNAQGLNLELFLTALFWGDAGCISNRKILHERTAFIKSLALMSILSLWWQNRATEQPDGSDPMKEFVLNCAAEVLDGEMERVTATVFRPAKDALSEANLTGINFRGIGESLQTSPSGAPHLWRLLTSLSRTDRQRKENTVKDPFHTILTMISMLAYSRSQRSCKLTIGWSIYLKACGLSARAFDALHALGLVMSYKWTCEAFTTVARTARVDGQRAIADFPHFGSHDNLNIPMRVFSQRLHNMNHFINATAITIYILPKDASLPSDIAEKSKAAYHAAFKEPFNLLDVYSINDATMGRVEAQARYRILRFLLESPAFASYPHRDDPLLTPPPPTDLLPCGPEHVVRQHILETVEIDESTYEGTDMLLNTIIPEQMGWGSDEAKVRVGKLVKMPWAGDQLSVDRMRGNARYRHDDPNSFARQEHIEPVFGWFHALMAMGNSLHAQYLGTHSGMGLRKAFETLGRKGLLKAETKGVFFHNLDEALWHIGEANFLALWETVAGVKDYSELVKYTPQQLVDVLDMIFEKHVSRRAQTEMDLRSDVARDDLQRQMAMFSYDLLSYFDLRDAMRIGDVGRMEDLLPTMLFRFMGGSNHKYATEILELLHKLDREWPEELRSHIRKHCWLVNFTGKRDGFVAVDMAQEHNVKDIKVTWRSFGPGATFPYIQKISPAIPVLRAVKESFTKQFPAAASRGKRHGTPSKDQDVAKLVAMYREARAHAYIPGRDISRILADSNRAPDFVSLGAGRLATETKFETWWEDRSFERATTEIDSVMES